MVNSETMSITANFNDAGIRVANKEQLERRLSTKLLKISSCPLPFVIRITYSSFKLQPCRSFLSCPSPLELPDVPDLQTSFFSPYNTMAEFLLHLLMSNMSVETSREMLLWNITRILIDFAARSMQSKDSSPPTSLSPPPPPQPSPLARFAISYITNNRCRGPGYGVVLLAIEPSFLKWQDVLTA